MTTEERKKKEERLLAEDPHITHAEIAKKLGVSTKTVQRDSKERRADGKLLRKEIPKSQTLRDEVFERTINTHDTIAWLITEVQQMITTMKADMEDQRLCDECNRKWRIDALTWQAFFKGVESMGKQVELMAKILGQITDSPQMAVYQIDADVELILRTVARLDEGLARKLYLDLVTESERRRRRLGEYVQVIEGESTPLQVLQLEEGSVGDE